MSVLQEHCASPIPSRPVPSHPSATGRVSMAKAFVAVIYSFCHIQRKGRRRRGGGGDGVGERPWRKKLLSHNPTEEGQEWGYNLNFCCCFFSLISGVAQKRTQQHERRQNERINGSSQSFILTSLLTLTGFKVMELLCGPTFGSVGVILFLAYLFNVLLMKCLLEVSTEH